MSKSTWGWIGMATTAVAAFMIGACLGILLTYGVILAVLLIGETGMRYIG